MTDDKKQWVIRDVPNRTRRIINKWAGDWDVSVAAALERLVDSGEKLEIGKAMRAGNEIRVLSTNNPDQLEQIANLVAELLEQRRRAEGEQDDKPSEQ